MLFTCVLGGLLILEVLLSVLHQIYEYIVSYELWFSMWYELSSEYLDPWKTLEEKGRSNLADYGIVIFVASQCGRLWYIYNRAFIDYVNYAWNDCVRVKVDARLWNEFGLCA